jgi:hypothetical protein
MLGDEMSVAAQVLEPWAGNVRDSLQGMFEAPEYLQASMSDGSRPQQP